MRAENYVKTLRDVLHISQPDLAKRLGDVSVSHVQKLEAEPSIHQARILLDMAEKAGSVKHITYFRQLLARLLEQKDDEGPQQVDLAKLEDDEQELVTALIEMYRNPDSENPLQKHIGALVMQIRKSSVAGLPEWLQGLDQRQIGVVRTIASDPSAMQIAQTVLSGKRGKLEAPPKDNSGEKRNIK